MTDIRLNCKSCGESFIANNKDAKYCGECNYKHKVRGKK